MKTKTILFVEDNSFDREIYKHQLEKAGFEVNTAGSGPDAVKAVENADFDLIILDIMLPGFDGFHVLEKLKESPRTAKIPVMVLTNLDEDKFLRRALQHGATEYLIKSTTTPTQAVNHARAILG